MNYLGIIPARYQSTRFPGKPLCMIGEKTMIQCVYEQASKVKVFSDVVVATDDERIFQTVQTFQGHAIMTSSLHQSGTERCAEVYRNLADKYPLENTIIVNIQGDEPFIQPQQIEELLSVFQHPNTEIATLVYPVESQDLIKNPNTVKVVMSTQNKALYFSRMPIPYMINKSTQSYVYHKHIGLYAYRADILLSIVQLPPSPLEKAENLEQLRWIENGYNITTLISKYPSTLAIDSPEDAEKANLYLNRKNTLK